MVSLIWGVPACAGGDICRGQTRPAASHPRRTWFSSDPPPHPSFPLAPSSPPTPAVPRIPPGISRPLPASPNPPIPQASSHQTTQAANYYSLHSHMAVPLTIPSSPSAVNSPTSTDGSNGPQTPVSPTTSVQTLALPPPVDGGTCPRRSQRANTAERRATHNAVERQRRETLNGRFLDLAALLPNLSQIRRPSKSSIVNSSIAHVHSSRRHRLLPRESYAC
ncbi:hypothetical protein SCP_0400060 [Sparassis crispa]|uniref:BHLH domain-containing protein n=1 Tax=Sparassis crispa TaxID=139825 RepID=A0A401GHP2_9APHY|nr:hypothetical protein SCP_0400060 [Sparassis crispa]GBE81635.1 hypothetical protein SCP_0400060 [Sparassis crispa]